MSSSSHVAVLAFPFGTHAAPLLTLVRRLAALAPGVRFSFFSTAKSNASTFSNEFDNIKPYNVWDGMPEGHNFLGNPHEAVEYFVKATPYNFKKVIKEAEAEAELKIGCLLTDAFLWFAGGMAEEMGVTWIPFWTAGACSLSVHIHTDLIRNTLGAIAKDNCMAKDAEQALTFIPGMSAIHVGDLPEGVLSGNLESPFALMLHNMGLKLPTATAIVLNSFEELDSTITHDLKSKLPKLFSVGPLTLTLLPQCKPDEIGCLLWLDKLKVSSVVYISFGTVMTPPPNELVALAEALEAKGVPFLWSLQENARQLLPKGFVERTSRIGKIVSWAPQLEVLAHTSVGIFVTHCGWNSILESISYSVPMICRPFFGDQMLNSKMVEDVWKIGVRVKGGALTKNDMLNAIDLIFSNKKGKELRHNIGVLKEQAIRAVESNGSSTQNFESLKEILTFAKDA